VVSIETVKDELFAFWGYIFPDFFFKFYFFSERVLVDFWYTFILEWSLAANQWVSDTTKCPNVDFFVIFHFFEELGSHVERWAQSQRHSFFFIEFLSKPKINKFESEVFLIVGDEHDVVELEVSVYNAFRMNIVQRLQYLLHDEEGCPFGIWLGALFFNSFHKRATFEVLADYIVVLLIF